MEFCMRSVAFAAVAAGSALFGLSTPALAQAPVGDFTGPRVEGIVGWDRSQAYGDHDDGVLYGLGAGYDIQSGNLVLGVDAEVNDSTAKDCGGGICAKAGRDLYIGGRVGTVVGARTLLYVKAGYTNARYKLAFDGSGGDTIDGRNYDGLRVGAGAEYALSPKTFVKAEYRYSNYQDGIERHQVVGGVGLRF
jgi:outer membrane immunogenic protein